MLNYITEHEILINFYNLIISFLLLLLAIPGFYVILRSKTRLNAKVSIKDTYVAFNLSPITTGLFFEIFNSGDRKVSIESIGFSYKRKFRTSKKKAVFQPRVFQFTGYPPIIIDVGERKQFFIPLSQICIDLSTIDTFIYNTGDKKERRFKDSKLVLKELINSDEDRLMTAFDKDHSKFYLIPGKSFSEIQMNNN